MTDLADLAARYVAVWNEPDADERRRRIAALWTEDGAHFMRDQREYRGHASLEERVSGAYERFVGTGEHVFVADGEPLQRGDAVRISWRMTPTAGGPPAGGGCDVLVMAADGRIQADYQFPLTS